MPPTDHPAARARRHDLDWLRVIAITVLVLFHAGMPFEAGERWHLRNADASSLIHELNSFLRLWRMPLLFLVSGVGTAYALGARRPATYLRERARRLLVPLVFGILVVVPPQIYVERLAAGASFSSYAHFWPTVFTTGAYPAGNFSWHHLWFIAYLFLYSAALLPLFVLLRGPRGTRVRDALHRVVARAGLPVAALPLALPVATLLPRFPGPQDIVHDWAMLLHYMVFFVYGFLLADSEALWTLIEERRHASLRWALLAVLAVDYLRWNDRSPGLDDGLLFALYATLRTVASWQIVVAILGFARRHLQRTNGVLRYANEGIYPVYILHQTVTVVLAYYVLPLREELFAKYLFLGVVTLALSWALYDALIRPFAVPRLLFGMRPLAREPKPAIVAVARTPGVAVDAPA